MLLQDMKQQKVFQWEGGGSGAVTETSFSQLIVKIKTDIIINRKILFILFLML